MGVWEQQKLITFLVNLLSINKLIILQTSIKYVFLSIVSIISPFEITELLPHHRSNIGSQALALVDRIRSNLLTDLVDFCSNFDQMYVDLAS